MTTIVNFDSQIFLISINAPAPISVYSWTRFRQVLRTRDIIGFDDEAEHSDFVANQEFSLLITEYKEFGIEHTIEFKKGQRMPSIRGLVPEPFFTLIEDKHGVLT